MGIATAVIAGLGVASAIGSYNSSKSQARQVVKAGEIRAYNRAEEIRSLAARQRVAYISAGLELEGTPQIVMSDTYTKGINDVMSITAAANQEAKNIRKQATAQLLGSLAKIGVSSFGSSFSQDSMIGNPSDGASLAGGSYQGKNTSGLPTWNLTDTASSGGQINFDSGYYKG